MKRGPATEYAQGKRNRIKKKCFVLYKQGLSVREIAPLVDMSFSAVAKAIRVEKGRAKN